MDVSNATYICDGTVGLGGHSSAILKEMNANARLLCIDQDHNALNYSSNRLNSDSRVAFQHGNYGDLELYLNLHKFPYLDACLVDCGISSYQLDHDNRGFSFQTEGILDMRMDETSSTMACDILNSYSPEELVDIFLKYGELKHTDRFVSELINYRSKTPFKNVPDLVHCIKKGFYFRNKRQLFIRTQAQVFQALRIEVNDELNQLNRFLDSLLTVLNRGGRCAIISFHSLEDSCVKRFIRKNKEQITPLTKGALSYSYHEAKHNTRARSAKLRVFQKL